MHITKHELNFLRDHSDNNPRYIDFLEHHGHLLRNPSTDVVNLSTILSQLSDNDMQGLLLYFSTRSHLPIRVANFDQLQRAVEADPTLFYTFVICMYYYL